MTYPLQVALIGQTVMTRVVQSRVRKVAFACYLEPEREVFVRELSILRFNGNGRWQVFHRVRRGIQGIRLITAKLLVDRNVNPYQTILEFADGRRIPLDDLVPNQWATLIDVPRM